MSVVDQLSSRSGDRTEAANRAVAARCLADRALLGQVAAVLDVEDVLRVDHRLLGDCAEVCTMVAEERPDLVAPHAAVLPPLLAHKKARVRWESLHALALVAALVPDVIAALLPRLHEIILSDASVITRDCAVLALGHYATTGEAAARAAYAILCDALTAFDGKQAGRALDAFGQVAAAAPDLAPDIRAHAARFLDHPRPVVRRSATRLLKTVNADP